MSNVVDPIRAAPGSFLDQREAPLLDAVLAAGRRDTLRLHTPAHQGQVDPEYGAAMGPSLALDVTELDDTDDLRDPHGAIGAAQDLAAAHFGADRTWFLVGGASGGNVAALLALAAAGIRKIVVGRNAHVSLVNGLILSGLEPVWAPAEWDADWDVARSPGTTSIAEILAAHPDAGAVAVTTPSYFGDAIDLVALRAAAGDRPLLVDEVHGAHAPSALAGGADLVVHSAQKGLSGPTQGGYLHLKGARVPPRTVAAALRLIQTTSPNYWILAGLDAARRQAASAGLRSTWSQDLAAGLARGGLRVRPVTDPARVLVGYPDGFAAYAALLERGVECEAALPRAVLLLVRPDGLDAPRTDRLAHALCAVHQGQQGQPRRAPSPPPVVPRAAYNPRAAALAAAGPVPLEQAAGRIAAEAVCPYPPGIPVLVPGEPITAEAISFLAAHAPDLRRVAVLR